MVTIYSLLHHPLYVWKPYIKHNGISDPRWHVMIYMQKLHLIRMKCHFLTQETTKVNPSFLIQPKPIQVHPFKTWTSICFSHWEICTITSLGFKIKSQNWKKWQQLSMLNGIKTLLYNTHVFQSPSLTQSQCFFQLTDHHKRTRCQCY